MERLHGWRHFHIMEKRRDEHKHTHVLMASTCDNNVRFWVCTGSYTSMQQPIQACSAACLLMPAASCNQGIRLYSISLFQVRVSMPDAHSMWHAVAY